MSTTSLTRPTVGGRPRTVRSSGSTPARCRVGARASTSPALPSPSRLGASRMRRWSSSLVRCVRRPLRPGDSHLRRHRRHRDLRVHLEVRTVTLTSRRRVEDGQRRVAAVAEGDGHPRPPCASQTRWRDGSRRSEAPDMGRTHAASASGPHALRCSRCRATHGRAKPPQGSAYRRFGGIH